MGRQLSLSLELILLFKWFLKNGKNRLRLLIREAVESDLADTLQEMSDKDYTDLLVSVHEDVLDFVLFLEDSLWNELDRKGIGFPRSVDGRTLNERMVLLGATKSDSSKEKSDSEKDELLKRLLESWKPKSNETVN